MKLQLSKFAYERYCVQRLGRLWFNTRLYNDYEISPSYSVEMFVQIECEFFFQIWIIPDYP